MGKPTKALKYMTQFECISARCEDHCCGGWVIPLDQDDCNVLENAMAQKPDLLARYHQTVVPKEFTPNGKHVALLSFDARDRCRFLDEGLCVIHRDLGEKSLAKPCATYPRILIDYGDQYQLSGSLSCPEVARLCLLGPDAMTWEAPYAAALPTRMEIKAVAQTGDSNDPYLTHIPLIRGVVHQLMTGPTDGKTSPLPLESRIYTLLYFAKKISGFYHRNCTGDPGPRLERAVHTMTTPGYPEKILRNFKPEHPGDLGARFIHLTLHSRLDHKNRARFNHLCMAVVAGFVGGSPEDLLEEGTPVPTFTEAVWDTHQQRKDRLMARFGTRIQRYFNHFSLNYIHGQCLSQFDDLVYYVKRLIFHLTVIRFLFFNHPQLAPLIDVAGTDDALDDDAAQALLDRVIVEAVQIYMKNVSHNTAMMDHIHRAMREMGFDKLSDTASLLWV